MNDSIEIMEGYPDHILASLESRDRQRRASLPAYIDGVGLELVFEDLKLWQAGTLAVSFKGGTPELHKAIAETASEWTKYANIQFDFGLNNVTGSFRQWIPGDNSHIRVGFEHPGYWSLVGTDSHDLSIVKAGEITLNLSGFDREMPIGWQGTVIHEFGHALGFHHEHQSPAINCDFDWDRLYETLSKPPNSWSKAKVDHNLRQLPGGGLTFSAHDKNSIMHYSFPEWMFKKGKKSTCFTKRNLSLSVMDKKMAGKAYPFKLAEFETRTNTNVNKLESILKFPGLKIENVKSYFERHLDFLRNNKEYETFFESSE